MMPNFRIEMESATRDISSVIQDRLIGLRITDAVGTKTDQLELVLDNRGDRLSPPKKGLRLQAWLGYGPQLRFMGKYIVDEVATTLIPRTITIRAKAADMVASLKVKKNRAWKNSTFGEVARAIASEHKLSARISAMFENIDLAPPPYLQLDQTAESDLHFLTRLAKQYDGIATIKNGYLLVIKRGEEKTATGQLIPPVHIAASDIRVANARTAARDKYKSVRAQYLDLMTQQPVSITTSDERPVLVLPHIYPDIQTAIESAEAKLESLKRGRNTLSLVTLGQPDIMAEGRISIDVADPLVRGDYIVTRVEHELNADGFVTRISGETPKAKS